MFRVAEEIVHVHVIGWIHCGGFARLSCVHRNKSPVDLDVTEKEPKRKEEISKHNRLCER